MKPELIVTGAAGRMGKRILVLAVEKKAFSLVGAVEYAEHPDLGRDAGTLAGLEPLNVELSSEFPETADVMIDFSLPAVTDDSIDYCVKNNVALVLGTTGLSESQMAKLKEAAAKIPVMRATNMSPGMNLLFALVGKVARSLGEDYDIEIVEAHHRYKKDAPSGTALSLAEAICKETSRDFPACLIHGREGKDTPREKGSIGIHAIRAGDIVGRHSVLYSTLGETITIEHNAHTRDTFARGAIRAALWLINRKPGLYTMLDVLGLKE